MPYKTKNNRKEKKRKKPKTVKKGGKRREEEIYISLGRQYTNPDIRGEIRVLNGPTSYKADSKPEYLINFISDVSKRFEEDLAVMLRGAPDSKNKQKTYKIVYHDNDAPLEEGSENPIKCKKENKKTKKKGGNLDFIDMGLDVMTFTESLSWLQYWMLLEQRLAVEYNDYDWLQKNRNLSIRDYNPELFSLDRIINDLCKEIENNPEQLKKVSMKIYNKYGNNFCKKSMEEKKRIIRNFPKRTLRQTIRKKLGFNKPVKSI